MTNRMPERIYAGKDGWTSMADDGCETPYVRADLAQKTVTRHELENILINAYEKNRPVSSAISALIAAGIVKESL